MKFTDRKPEELRAWLEENAIAQELIECFREMRLDYLRMAVNSTRAKDHGEATRHVGSIDLIDKVISMFERKPEKK